mmetsp:Transcript_28490/g.51940  ORF Transcript_28490/g.51940 Transcript_28490/m.51940 type:complete len:492 (-) Transcript_28490:530-2005(-)
MIRSSWVSLIIVSLPILCVRSYMSTHWPRNFGTPKVSHRLEYTHRDSPLSVRSSSGPQLSASQQDSSTHTSGLRKTEVILPTISRRAIASRKNKYITLAKPTEPRAKSSSGASPLPSRSKALFIPYESALKTLQAYHNLNGDLAVPRRFIVPAIEDYPKEWHGVDLAKTVYDMRWWQTNVSKNPTRVAALNALGFVWERLQPEWNLVLEALITYSILNDGDIMVPASFVVPHGNYSWPQATWGIPIGNCVYRIRHRNDFLRGQESMARRSQLDGLGFVWDVNDHLFRKFYRSLRHFSKLERQGSPEGVHRALRVPSKFVVPKSEKWPSDMWGFKLGSKCMAIRQKEVYVKNNPERSRELEKLGFLMKGNSALGWLEVVHAAAIYSKLHRRQLDVPQKFVVPHPPVNTHDEKTLTDRNVSEIVDAWPWPEQLWGFPLGQRLKDVRQKGRYLTGSTAGSRRAQLDGLGFNWSPKRGRRKRNLGGATMSEMKVS